MEHACSAAVPVCSSDLMPASGSASGSAVDRAPVLVVLVAVMTGLTAACRTVPVTGRTQLLMGSEHAEIAAGERAYRELLKTYPPSRDEKIREVVERVGWRIAAAADVPLYKWEFQVVADDQLNAFCLPGGKILVFEGILPVCQTEGGLAVLLAHEVAHALARHGGEDRTQDKLRNLGRVLVDEYAKTRGVQSQLAFGLGYRAMAEYGVRLPHSRAQETEADAIGMELMARAGYDPIAAVAMWQRMSARGSENGNHPFLSTHPSHETRIADLAALIPRTRHLYQAATKQYGQETLLPVSAIASRSRDPAIARLASQHYNSGVRFLESGDFHTAVREFSSAIALSPTDREALFNRGNAHFRLADFASASADYTAALELVPDYAPAQTNLQLAVSRRPAPSGN